MVRRSRDSGAGSSAGYRGEGNEMSEGIGMFAAKRENGRTGVR